jgi:transposase
VTPEMQWLLTLPGVGVILAATIALEIGEISRFATAERLASYAGTTPRVHSSGDRTRYGRTRPDVNRYLKWAFAEAGNSVAVNHRSCPDRHVSQLYFRLRQRKGHSKAVGAVARHLAEAAFHVLSRQEAYRDPTADRVGPGV